MLEKASDAKGQRQDYWGTKHPQRIREAAWSRVWGYAKHFRPIQEDIHASRTLEVKISTEHEQIFSNDGLN